ncbi:MAG: GTPase Era [Actinomycetota bacterium]|nr:GTPase Era [Actinomycetota bacterium]
MRSGLVPVVGRPNVGKSTLVNALVGSKVSITSVRPQTTRNAIRGVLNLAEAQLVFIDTPGLHKPRTALGERLNRLVYGTLAEADVVLLVLDATQKVGPGDRLIAGRLLEAESPVVVAVNKVDLAAKQQVVERLVEAEAFDFEAYLPVSGLQRSGLQPLADELAERLPEGPRYFPADVRTDQPDELLAAEIVREKFLARLREELPHSLTVSLQEMQQRANGALYLAADLVVERGSQKGMVIGRGGDLLRAAGTEARGELEAIFGTKVFLDLRVKVERDWQRHPQLLDRLGF